MLRPFHLYFYIFALLNTLKMSGNHSLDYFINKISSAFDEEDYYGAHKEIAPYMQEMAADKSILFEIVRRNLAEPGYIGMRYWGPIMNFVVTKSPHFSFDINCFLPGPTSAHTSISTQSIHHHGNLLLTAVGTHGNGYESFIFNQNYLVDEVSRNATMEIKQTFHNSTGHVSFVDINTPHVVFFPEVLNLSYALFSTAKKVRLHTVKNVGILQRNKELIKSALKFLGLLKTMNLQDKSLNFDFYPENGQLIAMKERMPYPPGPREAMVQNLFYILQHIGFDDIDFWRNREKTLTSVEKELTAKWAEKWMKKEKITCFPDAIDITNPKVNFRKEDVLACIKKNK